MEVYLFDMELGSPRVGIYTHITVEGAVARVLGLESPHCDDEFEPLQADSLEEAQDKVRRLGGWDPNSPWFKKLRVDIF